MTMLQSSGSPGHSPLARRLRPAPRRRPDLLASATNPEFRVEPVGDRTSSPLIASLASLPPERLGPELRREVSRRGTPLLEEDSSGRTILTFLHHHPTAEAVTLLLNQPVTGSTLADTGFERLPGTDLWHLSLRVSPSWRGSYALAVHPPEAPADGLDRSRNAMSAQTEPDSTSMRSRYRRLRMESALRRSAPSEHENIRRWYEITTEAGRDPWAREHLDSRVSVATAPMAPTSACLTAWENSAHGPVVADVPSGSLHETHLPRGGGGADRVTVHVPARQAPHGGWGTIVLLDGHDWLEAGVIEILDTLCASRLIRPSLTVLVGASDDPWRVSDLSCDERFVTRLDEEILPWVEQRWSLSGNPEHTAIAGQSLGGLTALFAQAVAPHRFGASVSQSGAFWWPVRDTDDADSEWLTRAVVEDDVQFDRVWLEAGLKEASQIRLNRRMRSALADRTCRLTYREFDGGHDRACWRESLADASSGEMDGDPSVRIEDGRECVGGTSAAHRTIPARAPGTPITRW